MSSPGFLRVKAVHHLWHLKPYVDAAAPRTAQNK
jgi:hypothetical protein